MATVAAPRSTVVLSPSRRDDPLPYRFMTLVARIVPLRVGLAAGVVIADAVHFLAKSKRLAARRNFAQVLGRPPDDPQIARLARSSFRNFGRYIVEMFHLQVLTSEQLQPRLRPVDLHHFQEAVDYGRGVILVTAHIGNMDASTALLPLIGAPHAFAAADEVRPGFFMSYLRRARLRWNVTLVPAHRSARRLFMALRRRKLVALFADLGIRETGSVRVRFFGKDTYFPAGPARLSRISGAPLVFGCAIRTGLQRFDIVVAEPVWPQNTSDETADMEKMTQRIVDQLEELIRKHPAQWYMFRDMWPAQPLPRRALGQRAFIPDPGTAAS